MKLNVTLIIKKKAAKSIHEKLLEMFLSGSRGCTFGVAHLFRNELHKR